MRLIVQRPTGKKGLIFRDTPTRGRTKQFGYQDVAEDLNFSKSDVGVVPTLAQHVLCGRFHGNHVFFGQILENDKLLYLRN